MIIRLAVFSLLVFDIKIDANVYSFQIFKKAKIREVAIAGLIKGIIMLRNVLPTLAPSKKADSSISFGKVLKEVDSTIQVNARLKAIYGIIKAP